MNRTATPVRKLTVAAASALLALSLAACGDDAPKADDTTSNTGENSNDDKSNDQRSRHALEQVVEANAAALDSQKETLKTVYSDVTVTAEGDNTLAITYVFANEMPAEGLEQLKGDGNPMSEQVRTTVLPQLEQAGVNDPQIRLVVKNPDGTEAFEDTISAEK